MQRTRRTLAAVAALVAGGGAACAYALGLPPSTPAAASAPLQERQGATLQEPPRPPIETVANRDSALAMLPRDNAGNVDWVAALRNGTIRPRAAAPGRDSSRVATFDYDFYRRNRPASLEAYFPHSSHTEWLTCRSCHPGLYRGRGDTTSMAAINQGMSCGVCHRTVAFPAATCERCHEGLPGTPNRVTATLRDGAVIARVPDTTATGARRSYPPASFSHASHRIRYRCSACHSDLFAMRAGAGSVRMADMDGGRACGACHNGTAAFALVRCERCHAGAVARPGP